jgi:hypothetical protein
MQKEVIVPEPEQEKETSAWWEAPLNYLGGSALVLAVLGVFVFITFASIEGVRGLQHDCHRGKDWLDRKWEKGTPSYCWLVSKLPGGKPVYKEPEPEND